MDMMKPEDAAALRQIDLSQPLFEAAVQLKKIKAGEVGPEVQGDAIGRLMPKVVGACCAGKPKPTITYLDAAVPHVSSALHIATTRGVGDQVEGVRKLAKILRDYPEINTLSTLQAVQRVA